MIIIPAIDMKDGKVVRLHQGRFEEVTVYSDDPVTMAQKWEEEGASWLHLVDLDGALTGTMKNFAAIVKIAKSVKIPIQVGGGIREKNKIHELFDAKIARVILGTKIIEDRQFLKEILSAHGEKIAISLDCSNGMVAQRGWTSTSQQKGTEFAKEMEDLGVRCLVYTDIARDGTLKGPNFAGIEELLNVVNIPVIASGGIANIDDVKKLCELQNKGVIGAITGKAIYDGRLDLREAIKVSSS